MSKIYLVMLILALAAISIATERPIPDWEVDASEYEFTASIIARVYINNEPDSSLSSVLGAFWGEECRGRAIPVQFGEETLYFLTVYANQEGDELNFRFYESATDLVIEIEEQINFCANEVYGTVLDPENFHGYSNYDHPPLLGDIPDQTISYEASFDEIALMEYLTELDGDEIEWSVWGAAALQVDLSDGTAFVSRIDSQWQGTETITFTATDLTSNSLSASDAVVFTVLAPDHPPQVMDIPDQTIALAGEFADIDLSEYLLEIDDDAVEWSYSFAETDSIEQIPDWQVDPGGFEANMSLTIEVRSAGESVMGGDHILAAFCGEECRGIAQGEETMGSWLYFLTVYAEIAQENITFRFYDAQRQNIMPVWEDCEFVANAVYGNPLEPLLLEAGFLLVNISDDLAEIMAYPNWIGTERVDFFVTDLFTIEGYTDFDDVNFTVINDHAPEIQTIPGQNIIIGQQFEPVMLDDYLLEYDGDEVEWSVSESQNFDIIIDNENIAWIGVNSQSWTGTESICFTVTDLTEFAAFASEDVDFCVNPVDHNPEVSDIPDQTISRGMEFDTVILNDYLTELDGDEIAWSYSFAAESNPQPVPEREVDSSSYDLSINLVVEVISEGIIPEGDEHYLYALCETECRGIARAIYSMDSWLYFMTVYANFEGDEISFEFYDADKGRLIPVNESLEFTSGEYFGTVVDPLRFEAGNLMVTIDEYSEAVVTATCAEWTGFCEIIFAACDANTAAGLWNEDGAIYSVLDDNAPQISDIPEQISFMAEQFEPLELEQYLIELDGEEVLWSFSGNENLAVSILEGNILSAVPLNDNWTGSEIITIRVEDNTEIGAWDSKEIIYTVLPEDNPPNVEEIPEQYISPDEEFADVQLNEYLTELDGDEISWSCEFVTNIQSDPEPDWTVAPSDYQYSMNLIAEVEIKGIPASGENHILAAFCGEECRGMVLPLYTLDRWQYFLTIYANEENEQISLRYYNQEDSQILPVNLDFEFENNLLIGSALEPEQLYAGFIEITLNQNIASMTIIDEDWRGLENVIFTATDLSTYQQLSDFDETVFGVTEDPVFDIPASLTFEQNEYLEIDFAQYLYNSNPENYILSAEGNSQISVEILGFMVTFSGAENWSGSETICFCAHDESANLSLSDSIQVIVTPDAGVSICQEFLGGWNWFSLNFTAADMNINQILASLEDSGSSIKNQISSALYYPGAGWFGSLTEMENSSLYKIYCNEPAEWQCSGEPVCTEEIIYELSDGWNWISYSPQTAQEINTALAPLEYGISVKNQYESAMYYAGAGWYGSLQELQPLQGYMLQLTTDQTFVYPEPGISNLATGGENGCFKQVYFDANPADYEYNAILIAASAEEFAAGSHLIARCGSQNRSICHILDYTEAFGKIYYSLMLYSNEPREDEFCLYYQESAGSELIKVSGGFCFEADMTRGDFLKPEIIKTYESLEEEALTLAKPLTVFPNPFNPETNISFELETAEEVCLEIYNIRGQKVDTLVQGFCESGQHSICWKPEDRGSGIYFMKLKTASRTRLRKLILMK